GGEVLAEEGEEGEGEGRREPAGQARTPDDVTAVVDLDVRPLLVPRLFECVGEKDGRDPDFAGLEVSRQAAHGRVGPREAEVVPTQREIGREVERLLARIDASEVEDLEADRHLDR